MFVVWGSALFSWYHLHWELVLFFCGMLIAELDLMRGAHEQSPAPTSPSSPILGIPISDEKKQVTSGPTVGQKVQTIYWSLFCLGGLYLMSQPDAIAHATPGWMYLETLIPQWWNYERYRYWQSVGAVLFVYGVGHSAGWQRFFDSAVVQYLGKISYAIYLMHGPVMHTAGYMIEEWAYGITGVEGCWFNAGFLLGFCVAVPTVVWAAE